MLLLLENYLIKSLPVEIIFIYSASLLDFLTCSQFAGLILLSHIIFHIITIALDPAHGNVRQKYNKTGSHEVEGTFNRNQQRHVIENQFCCLCEVEV